MAVFFAGLLSVPLAGQLLPPLPPPPPDYKPPEPPKYEEPPEEDESLSTPKVYTFNPLQAKKEIEVGNMHMLRGNYRGAVYRFLEATQWDDGNADAFYKLGEANEKLKDYSAAREAFTKYVGISSDKKKVADVQKRLAKYPAESAKPKEAKGSGVTLDDALKENRDAKAAARSKGIILQ